MPPPATRRSAPTPPGAVLDRVLLAPTPENREALLRLGVRDVTTLAERVRRRATRLARRERPRAPQILAGRDRLIAALYARAAPRDWHVAWCDAAHAAGRAGLGGVLADADGTVIAELARTRTAPDAFTAELAALAALLALARRHGARRLRAYTDCAAASALWQRRRTDPRLARLRVLARGLERFELRALPRLHNQPANRLARAALAAATCAG
jgi:hypothetical protein